MTFAVGDSFPEATRIMSELYARMTPAQKLRRVRDLTLGANQLALVQVRSRYANEAEGSLLLRLARRRLGESAMEHAYGAPELMTPDSLPDPIEVAVEFTQLLEELSVVYLVGGSLASSVYGEPRSTNDFDILAELGEDEAASLVEAMGSAYHVRGPAVR